MQVIGDLRDLKSALTDFFHSEIKESAVICFKFYDSALHQDPVVAAQILGGGKTAPGMSFFGPGIGKIEIDFVYFSLRKIGVDQFGVSADKDQIFKLQFFLFFKTSQENT